MITESQIITAFDSGKSLLQRFHLKELEGRGIELFVKRDDLIHPEVSGNKWRKLKYHLLQASQMKSGSILTFGGAYSNHLLATASACQRLNIKSIGVVRGEELKQDSNETLKRCHELGMKLHFVSREEYRMRNDWDYQRDLKSQFPESFLVPEGGASYYGMIGCQEIWRELDPVPDHLFVAAGTATTAAGLLAGIPEGTRLHVIPVIKSFQTIEHLKSLFENARIDAEFFENTRKSLSTYSDAHFGGYAKTSTELDSFGQYMLEKNELPLDRIYTVKAFYRMMEELKREEYVGSKVCFLHTGGIFTAGYEKND
ncbi:MAG: pyridoxal-phosphate dependent enzyme [Bacteroidetes bacterium]|nr:MAG: pyridoxal-phosphate dependent enzyme [Bacteroidota bacterium]